MTTPHDRTRARLERQAARVQVRVEPTPKPFKFTLIGDVHGPITLYLPCPHTDLIDCKGITLKARGWSFCYDCGTHLTRKGRVL